MTIETRQLAGMQERLSWWREARFGMFIHWGLYSTLGGEWKGRQMPSLAEWIMCHAKIPLAEYRRIAETFNPTGFDADAIAGLAARAGMRYLVITAKHHDGFAMYHSKVDAFNIVDATPFGRDPVLELSRACERHGVVFGVYYSQDLDWAHPDGGGNDWDFDPGSKRFERYIDEKCVPQLRELLTNYGRLGLIWFDMATNITLEQSRRIRELVHSIQPECLVSGRVGHGMGDYGSLGDNQMPLGTPEGDWETPGTLNSSWGYKSFDHNWRKPEEIINAVADLASKGVNYLLNIGPDGLGRVPEPSVDILEKVGQWMRINGEAIHGTAANPFDCEFDWGRVTAKGADIYLLLNGWMGGEFMLVGLSSQVNSVTLLGETPSKLSFLSGEKAGTPILRISLPDIRQPSAVPVIKVACASAIEVVDDCCQQDDGVMALPAHRAVVHRNSAASSVRKSGGLGGAIMGAEAAEANNEASSGSLMDVGPSGVTENWHSAADYLSWSCRIIQPGEYSVVIRTMARKYVPWKGGHRVAVSVGSQTVSGLIVDDGRVKALRNLHFEEARTVLGKIRVNSPIRLEVVLRAECIADDVENGLCVSTIRLEPA